MNYDKFIVDNVKGRLTMSHVINLIKCGGIVLLVAYPKSAILQQLQRHIHNKDP